MFLFLSSDLHLYKKKDVAHIYTHRANVMKMMKMADKIYENKIEDIHTHTPTHT